MLFVLDLAGKKIYFHETGEIFKSIAVRSEFSIVFIVYWLSLVLGKDLGNLLWAAFGTEFRCSIFGFNAIAPCLLGIYLKLEKGHVQIF